ncbi:MAG: hypothetical protein BA865_10945 [Desulfobacterales bacterium S5133MH4]|nr:MAG: hypothetical protein BA865_10945 [Desulfobacterales bacterium S5133MH4]
MKKSHSISLFRKKMVILLGLALLGMALIPSCSLFQGDAGQIISPEGGIFEFEDGIQMVVPPNTVSEDTVIHLTQVDPAVVADILENALLPLQPMTFFQVSAEGAELQNAVKVILPVSTTDTFVGWLVHIEIDLDTGEVKYPPTDLIYDPSAGTIELSLDSFSTHGTGTMPEDEYPNECENPATACRCGLIHVESRANDFSSGECQSISDEVSVTFLDCPGQPTEKHKISEMSPECDWKGSVSFHAKMIVEGIEMHLNCSDPIPFKIGEDGSLSGSGSMQCVLKETMAEGMHIDMLLDEEAELTGTFDGFELNFDPLIAKNLSGYLKSWAVVEGTKITIFDMTFDDEQASGDILAFPEFTLLSFTTTTGIGEEDRSEYAFKFPLEDGAVYEKTIRDEGALVILTFTLDLDIE